MCNHERIYLNQSIGMSPDESRNIGLTCEDCGIEYEIDGINHFVRVN